MSYMSTSIEISCLLRELGFWSNIAKEHPIFLLTVADLTEKNLPQELREELLTYNREFGKIEEEARRYYYSVNYYDHHKISRLIQKFIQYNLQFIETLERLKQYGVEDRVWQTLVQHIQDEQRYMTNLISNWSIY